MVDTATKTCRSCGAQVLWTVTHKGKRMPVDAEPTPDGNLRLRWPGDGDRTPIAEYPGKEHGTLFDEADNGLRYTSHFATCSHSRDWRRS